AAVGALRSSRSSSRRRTSPFDLFSSTAPLPLRGDTARVTSVTRAVFTPERRSCCKGVSNLFPPGNNQKPQDNNGRLPSYSVERLVPMSSRKTLVVAGHGMVGHRFVQAAIERGLTERYDIVIAGEESRAA